MTSAHSRKRVDSTGPALKGMAPSRLQQGMGERKGGMSEADMRSTEVCALWV